MNAETILENLAALVAERIEGPDVPRLALTRSEAARALGMSLPHFQRHVQPDLKTIRSGRLVLVTIDELTRWAETSADYTIEDDA
jgi:hypothetical protein